MKKWTRGAVLGLHPTVDQEGDYWTHLEALAAAKMTDASPMEQHAWIEKWRRAEVGE